MKKRKYLSLLLILTGIFLTGSISAELLAFEDDFSTDPNTNGKWTIVKTPSYTGDACVLENEEFVLTKAVDNRECTASADYILSSRQWRAEFDFQADGYSVGGHGDGTLQADGIAFYFYEYGIFLDTYCNDWDIDLFCTEFEKQDVAGIKLFQNNNVNDYLEIVQENKILDHSYHHYTVEFDNGNVAIKVDDVEVMSHTIINPDYTGNVISFWGRTGDKNGRQVIDNFEFYDLTCVPLTRQEACENANKNCGTVPDGCQSGGTINCGTCSASNPACDTSTNTCVKCTDDTTCTDPLVCDTTSTSPTYQECVQCTADDGTQCTAPLPGCDIDNKRCVQCTKPEHCPGQLCDTTGTNTCFSPPTNTAYWLNMRGVITDTADINDLVKLSLVSDQDIEGKEISYEIILVDGGFFWIDKVINAQTIAEGVLEWKAGENSKDIPELIPGQYYFKATIEGTTISTEDNTDPNHKYLTVSAPAKNDPPVAIIVGLENKQVYFEGEVITLSQESYDVDSHFTYEWEFDDGTQPRTGTDQELEEFTHTFTKGQKNVVLTVTDGESTARAQASILVIASDYVLAYIDTPTWGQTTFLNPLIKFDASSSYAISSDDNLEYSDPGKLKCLAGKCPTQTMGCPPDLTTDDCPIDIDPLPVINHDKLNFAWEIFHRSDANDPFKELPKESGILFEKFLTMDGDFKAKLKVTYTEDTLVFSETSTRFELNFQDPKCGRKEGIASWKSSLGEFTTHDPENSINKNCFWEEWDDPPEDPTCCLTGFDCVRSTGICEPSNAEKCEDYSEDICDGDGASEIIENKISGLCDKQKGDTYPNSEGKECFIIERCNCVWDSSLGCHGQTRDDIICVDSPIIKDPTPCDYGPVDWDDSKCDSQGTITATWNPTLDSHSSCTTKTRTFSCEQIVKLPFFTPLNIIIAIVLITIIYLIFLKTKK
jgi:hypothetical protein